MNTTLSQGAKQMLREFVVGAAVILAAAHCGEQPSRPARPESAEPAVAPGRLELRFRVPRFSTEVMSAEINCTSDSGIAIRHHWSPESDTLALPAGSWHIAAHPTTTVALPPIDLDVSLLPGVAEAREIPVPASATIELDFVVPADLSAGFAIATLVPVSGGSDEAWALDPALPKWDGDASYAAIVPGPCGGVPLRRVPGEYRLVAQLFDGPISGSTVSVRAGEVRLSPVLSFHPDFELARVVFRRVAGDSGLSASWTDDDGSGRLVTQLRSSTQDEIYIVIPKWRERRQDLVFRKRRTIVRTLSNVEGGTIDLR